MFTNRFTFLLLLLYEIKVDCIKVVNVIFNRLHVIKNYNTLAIDYILQNFLFSFCCELVASQLVIDN